MSWERIQVKMQMVIFHTLIPRQNGHHCAYSWMKMYQFRLHFHWIFVSNGQINNIPSLVQIRAWRRIGDIPSSETMIVRLLGINALWIFSRNHGQWCCRNIGWKKSHWRYTNARAFQIIDNMENQKKTTRIRKTVFFVGGLNRWLAGCIEKGPIMQKAFPWRQHELISNGCARIIHHCILPFADR